MDADNTRREELKQAYDALPGSERRRHIVLEPAYRDTYNEITRPDRIAVVPQYFWTKWAPLLGPIPSMLYLRLRQYCYHNPQTGETRNECWPKQSTLARDIGVKKRHTVGKALKLLEDCGFIEREKQYRSHTGALKHRTSDVYKIWFELPLTPDDAAELLIRSTEEGSAPIVAPKEPQWTNPDRAPKRPQCEKSVDNLSNKALSRPHIGGPQTASRSSTSKKVPKNVTNVGTKVPLRGNLSDHPTVMALTEEELFERESLALQIGDELKTMQQDRTGGRHPSYGFHRRIAFLMPEPLIRQALGATKDALLEQKAGRKGVGDLSGYFSGVVQSMASQNGIDLGIKWKKKARPAFEGRPSG